MKAGRWTLAIAVALLAAIFLAGGRSAGFTYYVVDGSAILWPSGQSLRYLSPATFPQGSDAETIILASMGLWNIVPGADFEYSYSPLAQDEPIDHFDGFNDTAALLPDQFDPGVLAVTYLVRSGTSWYDIDILFNSDPLGVGYTLGPNPDCDVVSNPLPSNGFSFMLVATHELGHAVGLGHDPFGDESPGTPWFIATMNPRYPSGGPVGQENIIELHTDDRNGVRFLYPQSVPGDPPFVDLASAGYATGAVIGEAVPLSFDPPAVYPGDELTARSVIENFGTTSESAVRQGFYLSSDAIIGPTDIFLGALSWDIAFGEAFQFEVIIDMVEDMPAGTHYLGAIFDDLDDVVEDYEDNNAALYCETLTVLQLPPAFDVPAQDTAPCGQSYLGPEPGVTYPLNMGPITWSLDSAPSGMVVDSTTGVVSWDAPAASPVSYSVTTRATNAAGVSTRTWELQVLVGDVNGDGVVNVTEYADFALCISGPGTSPDAGCTCVDTDFDGDVDLADFSALQTMFGS